MNGAAGQSPVAGQSRIQLPWPASGNPCKRAGSNTVSDKSARTTDAAGSPAVAARHAPASSGVAATPCSGSMKASTRPMRNARTITGLDRVSGDSRKTLAIDGGDSPRRAVLALPLAAVLARPLAAVLPLPLAGEGW